MGCAERCWTAYAKLVNCRDGGLLVLVVTGSCRSWGRHVYGRILVGGDQRRGGETTINSKVFWRVSEGDGHSAVGYPAPARPGELGGDRISQIGGGGPFWRVDGGDRHIVVGTSMSSRLGATGEGCIFRIGSDSAITFGSLRA